MKSWLSSITSKGGSGDFYDVSSYSDIEYKDIPNFSPNKVDIGVDLANQTDNLNYQMQ